MIPHDDYADMAELADAPDLGSGGRPCRFESCYPQGKGLKSLDLLGFRPLLRGMKKEFWKGRSMILTAMLTAIEGNQ